MRVVSCCVRHKMQCFVCVGDASKTIAVCVELLLELVLSLDYALPAMNL